MLTVSAAEISDALLKPIEIATVIKGLIDLENANVISSSVSANVVNAMFDDIESSTITVRSQITQLAADLRDQSEYLFGATDEINETIGSQAGNPTDMAASRLRLNNLYDSIRDGYSESTTTSSTITTMTADFFGSTALYRTNYRTAFPASTYSTTTVQGFANQIVAANTLLATQQTTLNQLKADYPELSIESANTKIATYLPNPFYVKLIDGTDYFHIYEDGTATRDIGSKFRMGSLIVDPAVNYTVHVLSTGSTNPAENNRRFMIMDGLDHASTNVYFTAQMNSNTANGTHFKSMAFEGTGANAGVPEYTVLPDGTLNGQNAVIDNV